MRCKKCINKWWRFCEFTKYWFMDFMLYHGFQTIWKVWTSMCLSCMANKDKLLELATEYFRRECFIAEIHVDDVVSLYKESWTFRTITTVEILLYQMNHIWLFPMKAKIQVVKKNNHMKSCTEKDTTTVTHIEQLLH